MSDTTKITKARVNGILYDLGGSGGTGGVSGAWLAPGELIESGYIDAGSSSSWDYMTINSSALIAQLEKAGVDVDETPFMDDNEYQINIVIGHFFKTGTGDYNLIYMNISASSGMSMSMLDSSSYSTYDIPDPRSSSLRQLIYSFFSSVTDLYCTVPASGNFSTLANYIKIRYDNANTTLRYYIPDMSEFCEEVLIEYTPSSE